MMENERDVVYDFYIQMLKSFCNGGKFLKLFILNFKIWQNKKIVSRGFSFKILDFWIVPLVFFHQIKLKT